MDEINQASVAAVVQDAGSSLPPSTAARREPKAAADILAEVVLALDKTPADYATTEAHVKRVGGLSEDLPYSAALVELHHGVRWEQAAASWRQWGGGDYNLLFDNIGQASKAYQTVGGDPAIGRDWRLNEAARRGFLRLMAIGADEL
ncbi:hypothetical protein A9K55_003698 [Cordyceps militaris]|uniref:Uncharacterized protein n=1 Tax=Cordyceps militaris TaxID=73501 RepID=A0A2H4S5T6_CORMI|nr:hypothetical protein A9K55_003698 [Cordyceps militaris]